MKVKLVVALLAALLFFSFCRPARAERDLIVPFHDGGHLVLDQLAGLRLNLDGVGFTSPIGVMARTESSESLTPGGPASETTTTSLWLAPSADVFVLEHVSVGGRIEIGHTWGAVEGGGQRLELPGATSMTFLPRVGFYVPFTDRIGLWPRIGFGWARTESASFLSTGSAPVKESFKALVMEADLALIYRFSETFFMRAGPQIGLSINGRREVESGGTSAGAGGSVLQFGGSMAFGMNLEL